MNKCEDLHGELSAQVIDATGWEEESVRQYRWVAKSVPFGTRVTGVSFFHYRELADLPGKK